MPSEPKKQEAATVSGSSTPSPPSTRNPDSILGFSMADLGGLSIDDIQRSKPAITMVMHYYKQLTDENTALRNDLNTLRTYVDAYRGKKLYAAVGAGLQFVGTILVGFGINLLTSNQIAAGVCTLAPGVIASVAGIAFSLREPT